MKNGIKTKLPRALASGLLTATLMGCDLSGGTYDPAFDDTGNVSGHGLGSHHVPLEHISDIDSSVTVQAVQSGLDVHRRLINTSFSCYDHDTINYSQPYVTFTVNGDTFVSDRGNGRINYDHEFLDFSLIGGPFNADSEVSIDFTDHGQEFYIDIGNSTYDCHQHGANIARAFHQYLLNTPETGDYSCRHEYSTDVRAVRLSPGGTYETAQGSGRYSYSDIIRYPGSEITFSGGALAGVSSEYNEDPDSGLQSFSIYGSDSFGAIASSSRSYFCTRVGTPRPHKRYGQYAATPVAQPSVALNGLYYYQDFRTSGNTNYFYADYMHFRPDGYVRLQHSTEYGDDCGRTKPNGLNYCYRYDVVNGELHIYRDGDIRILSKSIVLGSGGTISKIGDEFVERVSPSSSVHISGVWENVWFNQTDGCTNFLTACYFSYYADYYRLYADGRFISLSTSDATSTIDELIAQPNAYDISTNDIKGYYEIRGNRLVLWYANGDFSNEFIHQTRNGDLTIGDSYYFNESN